MRSPDIRFLERRARETRPRLSILAAVVLVFLSGCLPYSCRREESAALMPADSLSRALAADVAMDTLDLRWTEGSGSAPPLEHPRTVRFGSNQSDTLYVSDAEQGLIYAFNTEGTLLRTIETVDVPYLAGVRGDTVAVFDPAEPAFHFMVDGVRVGTVSIADTDRPRTALVYGAVDNGMYYKRVDEDAGSFVAEVGPDGSIRNRHALRGPHWRHAGLLRPWGDSLLSLSGFRPVVDVLTEAGRIDSLGLHGFDSPMLARSRSYMLGEVHEAPLLSASAAAEGDRLFVLNMRPGWLRIDVFDQSGQLLQRLIERQPDYTTSFFPQDLAVRRQPDGSYSIAVVFTNPEPALRLYSWNPGSDSAQ